jgi:ubiquinone biosynthesis protein Coq4
MVGSPTSLMPRRLRLNRINPLTGINGSELRRAYAVFVDNPAQGILHILAAQQHSLWQHWVVDRLARQAAPLAAVTIAIDIPQLLELPASTLGGAYARHIVSQGFDPEAFQTSASNSHWVSRRAALSHDVYHIITGFNSTPVGEFGLAAFCLVQYRDLLNSFVLSFVPWTCIGYPRQIPQILAAVAKGFWMGCRSLPIFAYPFESNWEKPVEQVRQELGIA